MNEARIEAYLALIQALLQCENGQEPALLQANAELLDAGLVAVMGQYADFLQQQGEDNRAGWLRNMAQQLGQFLDAPRDNQNPYISFLQTLLQTVAESDGNPQVIYPLLDNNLHLLDENLVNLLRAWGNQTREQASPGGIYLLGPLLYSLAEAFYRFPKGNPGINLAIAVYGYEVCATIYRQLGLDRFKRELARTLTDLGLAYRNQAELGKEPVANLARAIATHTEAATILRQPGLESEVETKFTALSSAYYIQKDLATNLIGLGSAYGLQAELEKEPMSLERAIAAYTEATTICRQPGLEGDLAGTLSGLGNAYSIQAQLGQEPVVNLELAIATHTEATTVCRPLGLERLIGAERALAINLNGLGNAYRTQARLGKEPVANLERAIANYREALSFLNPALLPADTLITGRNLGNLGFQQGWWDIAIEGYSVAVEAVEQSRAWATSEALRQEIVRESIGVYENLIQAAVNQGDLSLALRTVERSRSKRLADLIAISDLYADGRIPPEIQAWYQQLQDSRRSKSQLAQDRPELSKDDKPSLTPALSRNTRASFASEQLLAAEAAERQAWEALYRFDAITAQLQQPQPQPRLDELMALLPSPQTALLSFYTTATHTHIFVLRRPSRDGGESVNCHTIPNPPESANDLQNWLVENWTIPYIAINQAETAQSRQQRREEWHQAMAARLQELATRLQFDTLIQQHLQGITELILIPHLFLHQIPFDLLPTAEGQLLGDRFRLQFVPSTKILGLCQERSQPTPHTLGIVENTTEDLPYTPLECEWVAQTWNVPRQRRLQGRTVTPDSYLQLLKQVQALLSSHHATSRPDDPLNSHLVLDGEQKVTLRDLISPSWRFPELSEVFLSCCETGLSFAGFRDEEGNLRRELLDEPLSLGTGFLLGGARAVISSHWAVTDLATALFSREYHRARRAGEERLTALHQARQALRETCQKDWRDSLTVDYQQAYQTWQQMRQTKDPNVNAAQANYQKIGELIKWLDEFAPDAVPFQDYRYWGAFYCLGLP